MKPAIINSRRCYGMLINLLRIPQNSRYGLKLYVFVCLLQQESIFFSHNETLSTLIYSSSTLKRNFHLVTSIEQLENFVSTLRTTKNLPCFHFLVDIRLWFIRVHTFSITIEHVWFIIGTRVIIKDLSHRKKWNLIKLQSCEMFTNEFFLQ